MINYAEHMSTLETSEGGVATDPKVRQEKNPSPA